MTILTDQWGVHPRQFWVRGQRPERMVEFDAERGLWNVYGHAEALAMLGDPQTFLSDTTHLFDFVDESMTEGSLVQMDGLEHRKLRKLVSHAFTPKIVADLAPRISALTHELLDAVEGRDEIELVADLAYPLPVIVIAELLGVPSSDRDLFRQWVDTVFDGNAEFSRNDDSAFRREFEQRRIQLQPMLDYLAEHAAERRRVPREDLLTQLVQAEVDGERLTDNQVVNFANLLLIAGHITTTMLLGNTMLCLDRYPEQAVRVRADRALVPTAIEESLRLLSPFSVLGRATATEVTLGGEHIPADQLLMVWIGAANRDGRQFAEPDVFDPARDPNPHLGFGRGVHFCLGAPLARLEGRIALNILLDRFPALRIDPDAPPAFMPSPQLAGVRTLPLRTTH